MKRIFVAIDISREARLRAADYIENLKNEFSDLRVGWEKPEKLHLTLRFLGEIENSRLAKVQQTVRQIAEAQKLFELEISGTGIFPNTKNANILWLGLKEIRTNNLVKIKEQIESNLEILDFKKEKRQFKPHLTIGRIREPHKSERLVEKHIQNKFEPVCFKVSEFVIYESQLKPAGSIYSVISKFKFG